VIGVKPINAAALVIPFLFMAAVGSTITNYIASKWGHVRPFLLLSYVVLPVSLGLMSTLNDMASIGQVVGYSLLSGFSFGIGAMITIVVAQVGVPREELSTVTALIGTTPNLGGVLGVGIIGNVINNTFRNSLLHVAPQASGQDLNDVVQLLNQTGLSNGVAQMTIIGAFVKAWRAGCLSLSGIAACQFILTLLLRPIEMDLGARKGEETGNIKT